MAGLQDAIATGDAACRTRRLKQMVMRSRYPTKPGTLPPAPQPIIIPRMPLHCAKHQVLVSAQPSWSSLIGTYE